MDVDVDDRVLDRWGFVVVGFGIVMPTPNLDWGGVVEEMGGMGFCVRWKQRWCDVRDEGRKE